MAKTKVKASKNGQMPLGKHIAKNWRLYMFLVIPIIYYLVFRYIPMFGNVIAFRKYRAGGGIFGVEWSGSNTSDSSSEIRCSGEHLPIH